MLLKVGAAMMLCAVALAAVVAVVVGLSGGGARPGVRRRGAPVGRDAGGDKEGVRPRREAGDRTQEAPQEHPAEEPEPPVETLPVDSGDWPEPSGEEIAAVDAPRYYPPRQDGVLSLTVDAIGLYDVPVINANTGQALDNGVIHVPQTPMPWEEREQKNVYLAGHRLGHPGTGSRLVFYNLDRLSGGDVIVLKDSLGEPYEYRVSEVFVVDPNAAWVVDPVRGRDMVTLQTCTFPDLVNRLIVRADRV